MRHVFPIWIVLDGLVELCGTLCESVNAITIQAAAPLRVRVPAKDSLLDFTLQARPLFLRRLFFHPRRTL